ncbi:cytosine permease [Pseudonocardia sp. DSM 110487]|uniref:cytosine permease n=1 Tax=Pseudonocardia sp. DSM 110487 TaxID=2865833 RepID=UPI001C6A4C9F|nr:cytosine permease [Pseudonocardia sp. DSM 110487]QYN33646.1 cytosine permease [Pseudonocardia sp. DSM 110487]
MSTGSSRRIAVIEHRTIGPIPADERTGSARGLFGIWLGVNMLPLTVVTGALGTTLFALPFGWAVLAVVVGNVVGGVFMALHAAQGPQLGVPQMIQARGQFGAKGAALVVLVATVMFMGFYISNLVVGAQSLHGVVPSVATVPAVIGAAAVSMAITVVGLRLIKAMITVAAVVVGLLVVVSFVWIVVQGVPAGVLSAGELTGTSADRDGQRLPVTDPNPLWAIHTAATRLGPPEDHHSVGEDVLTAPLEPEQALDPAVALDAYTVGSAYANHRDHEVGRIEIGYLADVAVLDRPIFGRGDISSAQTVLTLVGGQAVHREI